MKNERTQLFLKQSIQKIKRMEEIIESINLTIKVLEDLNGDNEHEFAISALHVSIKRKRDIISRCERDIEYYKKELARSTPRESIQLKGSPL